MSVEISICEIHNPSLEEMKLQDEEFEIDTVLVLHADANRIRYTFQPVTPYRKRYHIDWGNEIPYPGEAGTTAYFAYVGEQKAGRILLRKSWNNLVYIDDICVDAAFRCQGIGARLLACAEDWARQRGLPGIMLETQNTNPAACRLYARCGFELCGFDTHLYKGIPDVSDEIALYWYKMLS